MRVHEVVGVGAHHRHLGAVDDVLDVLRQQHALLLVGHRQREVRTELVEAGLTHALRQVGHADAVRVLGACRDLVGAPAPDEEEHLVLLDHLLARFDGRARVVLVVLEEHLDRASVDLPDGLEVEVLALLKAGGVGAGAGERRVHADADLGVGDAVGVAGSLRHGLDRRVARGRRRPRRRAAGRRAAGGRDVHTVLLAARGRDEKGEDDEGGDAAAHELSSGGELGSDRRSRAFSTLPWRGG